MVKHNPLVSFLLAYFLLIFGSYLFTFLLSAYDADASTSATRFVFAVGQASLTSIDGLSTESNAPLLFTVSSIVITQLSGIVFLSFLLWYYWQLFSDKDSAGSVKDAFKLTAKIFLLTVSGLFLFFLYAHPQTAMEVTSPDKVMSSLSLAVGSFNNAGFQNSTAFPHSEILLGDSIIQLGIIAGTAMGNLGIFVIDELLSPKKLRQRLENPSADWSMLTKLVVFGTGMLLVSFSAIYWVAEYGDNIGELNLLESIIASVYEISVTRGFGFSTESGFNLSAFLKFSGSLLAAGPFSTGGGLTLLSLLLFGGFLFRGFRTQRDFSIAFQISKRLAIYTIATFLIVSSLSFLVRTDQSMIYLLSDHWKAYSTNKLQIAADTSLDSAINLSLSNILGRIGFIVACHLTLVHKSK